MGSQDHISGGLDPSIALPDLHARIQDFLERREVSLGGKLDAILRRAGSALSGERIISTLRGLLHHFHREEVGVVPSVCMEDRENLAARIRAAGREGTIENYSPYLFTVNDRF